MAAVTSRENTPLEPPPYRTTTLSKSIAFIDAGIQKSCFHFGEFIRKLEFATIKNTIILFVWPSKFCIRIVFIFSWDHRKSQEEKLETMLMQNFAGTSKDCCSIFDSGE